MNWITELLVHTNEPKPDMDLVPGYKKRSSTPQTPRHDNTPKVPIINIEKITSDMYKYGSRNPFKNN